MSKHTPEPWTTVEKNGIYLTLSNGDTDSFPIIWSKKTGMDVAYIVPINATKYANAARIVSCVNACAGINPDAVPDAVAALRVLLEGYEKILAQSELDVNPGANRYSITARAALAKLEPTNDLQAN